MAWRAISDNRLLEGCRNPRKTHGSHMKDINKRLTRMLRHFSYEHPPPKREKYIPLGLVIFIAEVSDPSCPFSQ